MPLQHAVRQGLEEAGFAVDVASDGQEALWFARSGDYDAIILDLMLPKVDGLRVLTLLRQGGSAAHALILTAKDTIEDRVKGLDLGADDYLVKPFAMEELLARVRALVRRKYNTKDPMIRIADLQINTATHAVERSGRQIELTAREYALLEFLAVRAGEVVSRTAILEHLYDFDAAAESNVVDVYIGYLRKKIEREGLPPLIHTRRGEGYVLRGSA